jgi:glycosyltransferase involved in cell wall biosynthesis
MEKRIKVLWLPAWFPSKQDFLNGDFIERHAQAVSIYADVIVIYVFRDINLKKNTSKIEFEKGIGLEIYRAYYNSTAKWGVIGKLLSSINFFLLQQRVYKLAKDKSNGFDLVHVHISQRQALFAIFLKITEKIKYVISEQNSWFMPFGDIFFAKSFLLKYIVKQNFKRANAIHVVSASLGNELKKKYIFIKNFTVVPNVVNSKIFFPVSNLPQSSELNFFAITGNTYHKNTDGVIRAFSNYLKSGYNGCLYIAGPNTDELEVLAKELSIENNVIFHGVLSNTSVAKMMQTCDVFVFFTRYETFGCVMAEALCCGKPIIASALEVLKENVEENVNALLVTSEDEDDLTKKLMYFSNNKNKFDSNKIAKEAIAKYNLDKVGKELLMFYKSVLKEK